MASRVIQLSLVLLGLSLSLVTQAARNFDGPPKATVQWVTQNTNSIGMQLQIRRFQTSSMSQEQVLQHYRREWRDQAAETDLPPWKMIGTKRGDEYWNVQVQSSGRNSAWGYLSISDAPEIASGNKRPVLNQGNNFPKMSGSQVINDFEHNDVGRKARTLVLQNDFSVSSNASYYRQHYLSKGYTATIDHVDSRKSNHVLMMNKFGKEVALTIHRNGGKTNVVANEVKHGF